MAKDHLNYWFGIEDVESELCGVEFFVAAFSFKQAKQIAKENFPKEKLSYYGVVSDFAAECMGLDTY